jgi:ubiquinone/menaquinone biosynthesis C-methylase UbiE
MDPRLQLRVQRYGWDKAEPFYEAGWKHSLKPAQDLLLRVASLKEGEKVLDISCGTGIVSFQAAEQVGPQGQVLGIDISDNMIATSVRNADTLDLNNVSFKRMQAENLELRDSLFDVALNALGLMYYPNPEKAVEEMNRVLVTDGRAVSAVWGARKNCGWSEIFPIVDSRVNTEVCPLFFQLGTGDALTNLYRSTGFHGVKLERINTKLHYPSAEEALNAAFAGGPVAMAYARFDEPTKESAHQEYLSSIQPFKQNGEYFIPGEFVVVTGAKN